MEFCQGRGGSMADWLDSPSWVGRVNQEECMGGVKTRSNLLDVKRS